LPLHLPDYLILAAMGILVTVIFLRRKRHRWGGCRGACSHCAGCTHSGKESAYRNASDAKGKRQ